MSTRKPDPVLLPGATLGMLGGGQLGRMSILAGRRLGYRFVVLEPKADSCAGMVADAQIEAAYDDPAGLDELARRVDRVTLEFENIPADAIDRLTPHVAVHPGREVLHICQNRRREKEFLKHHGLPHADFRVVASPAEVAAAADDLGRPCVLKTADFGYDGKGQQKITADTDPAKAWAGLGAPVGVVESWVDFAGEYSVLIARNGQGGEALYPVVRNVHRNHILHTTTVPAGLTPAQENAAAELARQIAAALDLVGLLAVELFLTTDGAWLVNELAPRPHNSGHWSFDGAATSQFEQHIRAVCGLPLGDPRPLAPSCMVNLLGDTWLHADDATPGWANLLADPRLKLHLYDKGEPRAGRKMGHFTLLGDPGEDPAAVEGRALAYAEAIRA